MNDSPSNPHAASADGQRDPVEALVEQFFQRRRAGEPLTVEQFARQHARWAADLRDLLPALIAVEDLQDDASGESAAAEPPDAPPLKQLGDFRIVREIGRGGMGVVYEAEQVSLGRRVAVKVLPRPVALDSRHKRRFRREARAAARLHHTNIVPVFSVDRQDGLLFYVMQYIHGMGLDAVLGELKRLRHSGDGQDALPEAAAVAAQGAAAVLFDQLPTVELPDGLSAAAVAVSLLSGRFERPVRPADPDNGDSELPTGGIAPAPISPVELDHSDPPRRSDATTDSVVLTLPGSGLHANQHPTRTVYWQSVARIGAQVAGALHYAHEQGVIHRDIKPGNLLLDVRGVTWVADFGLAKAADQRDLTHTGDILGTLRYMAPEQFEGRADARSDVYSLGLTLYELLALQPAFDERDRNVLIRRVTTGTPARLRALDRHIPRDLETIVHKAIDRDPGHRYQTAGDLAADLQRFLGDEPIRAKWASPVTRFSRWCKRNPAVALLTVTILALLMVGTIGSVLAAVSFRDLAQEKASAYTRASDDRDLARKAQDDAMRRLFDSSLAEAQASRWSGRPGQRLNAMAAIERASGLIAPLGLGEEARAALRDEAIAAMSLADLKRVATWDGPPRMNLGVLFSPDLSHYAIIDQTNKVIRVRSTTEPEFDVAVLPQTRNYWGCHLCPNNRYLVYLGYRPAHATVWDLTTQKAIQDLTLPGTAVCADISPDGRLLALGQQDEVVSIYELDTGKLIRQLRPTKAQAHIRRVKFSPDGRLLAVGWPKSGTIEVLDVITGAVKLKLSLANSPEVWSIAWDPQGRWLAVGSWKEINIWDLRQPNRPPVLVPGHESAVDNLQFHPSGELLASYSWDGTLRIWEAATGFQLLQLEELFLGFSPDGRRMAVQRGMELGLCDVILPVGSRWIYANEPSLVVALDRDDRLLALGNYDGIRLYDLKRHQQLASHLIGQTEGLLFHPVDGGLVTSTANSRGVQHWPVRPKTAGPGSQSLEVGPPKPLHPAFRASKTLSMSQDGQTVMAQEANQSEAVLVNLTACGQRVLRLQRPAMRGVAVSPDGNWAAAGNWPGQDVYVWNARTGEQVRVLTANASAWVYFSPDNRWLAANSGEAVRFWEVGTWRLRYTYPATSNVQSPVAFTRDCRVAAIGRRGVGLHLIDLSNGKPLAMLASNQRRPHFESMCFSSDGGTLVVAQGDAGVCVWDLRTIRRRLRAMGLDWDQPPIPDPRDESPAPLLVEVNDPKNAETK